MCFSSSLSMSIQKRSSFKRVTFLLLFFPRSCPFCLNNKLALPFSFLGWWIRMKLYSYNSSIHQACQWLSSWGARKYSRFL
jgi:hypothetical protein